MGNFAEISGQLFMTLWFPIWAFWFIFIPFVAKSYYIFIAVGPVCLFLAWRGYHLMQDNWKPVPKKIPRKFLYN
jgi:hypothetical protein